MPEMGGLRQPKPAFPYRLSLPAAAGVADGLAGVRVDEAVQLAITAVGQGAGVAAEAARLAGLHGGGTHGGLAIIGLLPRGVVDGGHGADEDRGVGGVAHGAVERALVTTVIHE